MWYEVRTYSVCDIVSHTKRGDGAKFRDYSEFNTACIYDCYKALLTATATEDVTRTAEWGVSMRRDVSYLLCIVLAF
jgi:hypothetical protein